MFAGIPGLDDGGEIFGFPRHGDGAAAAIHEDDGLANFLQCLEEFILDVGQLDARAVAAEEAHAFWDIHFFTFELGADAADVDDYVRCFGDGEGVVVEAGCQFGVGAYERAAFVVNDFEIRTDGGADSVQKGDGVGRGAIVIAEENRNGVGVSANDGDSFDL